MVGQRNGYDSLVRELVVGGWRLDGASPEEIVFLGEATIQEMIRRGRRCSNALGQDLKRLVGYQDQARSRMGDDLGQVISKCRSLPVEVFKHSPYVAGSAEEISAEKVGRDLAGARKEIMLMKKHDENRIHHLTRLKARAEAKPCFPVCRLPSYFKAKQGLVGYVGVADAEKSELWIHGKKGGRIAISYGRRLDPPVTVETPVAYRYDRPEVMYRWEFEYLLANSDFAALYAQGVSPELRGFDDHQFLDALEGERRRRVVR